MRTFDDTVILIEPAKLDAFASRLKEHAALPKDMVAYLMGERPKPEKVGTVAVLPISGTILSGTTQFERDMGAADVAEISQWLDEAAADDSVKSVLFAVDSPGGTVTGVPELAAKIANFPKTTAAYTEGMAASAAYWLASQANHVWVTPSASVGSIGVYVAFKDVSAMLANAGVKVDVIKAGDLKAAGHPGTALTAEQRAEIQASVDDLHAEFKAAVKSKRTFASEADMRGQTIYGKHAAVRGLATGIALSRAEAVARLQSLQSL